MAKKEKKEKKEKSGLERVPVAAWVALIAVFFFYKQGGFGGGGGSSVSSGGGGGNSDIVGSNSAQTSGQNPKETYQIPKMKGPSYKNKMKQKFQVTVSNQLEEDADLYFDDGEDGQKISEIPPGENVMVDTTTGAKFFFVTASHDQGDLGKFEVLYHQRYYILPGPLKRHEKYAKQTSAGGMPVRFKSLWHETVDIYYLLPNGQPPQFQMRLEPGAQGTTVAYESHQFRWSPLEQPDVELGLCTITPDVAFFRLDPEDPDSDDGRALLEEAHEEDAYMAEYEARTGSKWLGFFPKQKPVHFMWPAKTVGDTHELTTVGKYECVPGLPSKGGKDCFPELETKLTIKVAATKPKAFIVQDFLSATEVEHLVSIGAANVKRSTTMARESATRTSSNTWVYRQTDAITDRIYRRVAQVARIDEKILNHEPGDKKSRDGGIAEAIQLVYYKPGQEYNPHHDWWVSAANREHSRFMTFLLYLNDPASEGAGGATAFPKSQDPKGLSIHPGKGGAAFFYNLLGDGNPDDLSMHAAEPVLEGEKWLANVWLWDPQLNPKGFGI